ncbi:dihydroorotate dehydrogenase-like protein [Bradyrhizobium sp. dw_78]|uniref:dihydroorotate dehydrogenase-like protein n=1 Tax=Bradyrhizobium sp. dw_78 TaxID=2719793 RepID=UPI001BD56F7D|nr:dihydroorotate dehydrogenase-like protein [Bradyrhizobium sp. dw_78]
MSLATHYLGLSLKNPVVASAAPVNAQLDHLRRLEDAGAAAVVLPSLFQEQIEAEAALHDHLTNSAAYNSPEASDYFPPTAAGPYGVGPDAYLDLISSARAALSIPVIASLNGSSEAGWIEYAKLMQQAGADALELNMYFVPVDIALTGQSVEDRYVDIVSAARKATTIPLAVKLSPYLSSLGNLAQRLHKSGANGLVLFNRLLQPDIDPVTLRLVEGVHLSTRAEMPLPLFWIALLAGRTGASLAASTGVENADDVVKYLLAGADVVMTTSAVLRHGAGHVTGLIRDLETWMEARQFASVSDLRGLMSWKRSSHKERYGRPSYIKMLETGVVG